MGDRFGSNPEVAGPDGVRQVSGRQRPVELWLWMGFVRQVCQLVGQPKLDQRLAGDANSLRLMVEGFDHPTRKVDIDTLDRA